MAKKKRTAPVKTEPVKQPEAEQEAPVVEVVEQPVVKSKAPKVKKEPIKISPTDLYIESIIKAGQKAEGYTEFSANVRGVFVTCETKHNPDLHGENANALCHLCDDSYPTIQSIFEGR